MNYDKKPKPCYYNGRLYRSRLEARWSCFFDKIGWQYEYEPSELNGHNPDFIIKCNTEAYPCNSAIVEVKPSVFVDDNFEKEFYKKYQGLMAHLLILTDNPFYWHNDYLIIGRGSQYYGNPDDWRSEIINLEMKTTSDFGSLYQIFDGMLDRNTYRKQFISNDSYGFEQAHTIKSMWNSAANKTMFLKPAA